MLLHVCCLHLSSTRPQVQDWPANFAVYGSLTPTSRHLTLPRPAPQKNFTLVVLAIVAVSVVPVIIEIMNARKEAAQGGQH